MARGRLRTEAGRRAQSAPKGGKRGRRRRRARATTLLLRWTLLGALALVGFLYYQPLRTYVETRGELSVREAEVRELRAERQRLELRLERSASIETLVREARRIGYVEPGERLYVVHGVKEWRRAQRATIGSDG